MRRAFELRRNLRSVDAPLAVVDEVWWSTPRRADDAVVYVLVKSLETDLEPFEQLLLHAQAVVQCSIGLEIRVSEQVDQLVVLGWLRVQADPALQRRGPGQRIARGKARVDQPHPAPVVVVGAHTRYQ